MKRLILIACSFLVLFAGVAAAWESCKRVSFLSDDHHQSSNPVHAHDHHPESDRQHSHDDGAIHCPPLDGYLPTAIFSLNKDRRVERVPATLGAGLFSQFTQHGSFRLIHGPPGFAHSSIVPPYLLLSVLRI
jgi:hypothetical protein